MFAQLSEYIEENLKKWDTATPTLWKDILLSLQSDVLDIGKDNDLNKLKKLLDHLEDIAILYKLAPYIHEEKEHMPISQPGPTLYHGVLPKEAQAVLAFIYNRVLKNYVRLVKTSTKDEPRIPLAEHNPTLSFFNQPEAVPHNAAAMVTLPSNQILLATNPTQENALLITIHFPTDTSSLAEKEAAMSDTEWPILTKLFKYQKNGQLLPEVIQSSAYIILKESLREFLKNSKDAGATEIKLLISWNNRETTIHFIDNGSGFKSKLLKEGQGLIPYDALQQSNSRYTPKSDKKFLGGQEEVLSRIDRYFKYINTKSTKLDTPFKLSVGNRPGCDESGIVKPGSGAVIELRTPLSTNNQPHENFHRFFALEGQDRISARNEKKEPFIWEHYQFLSNFQGSALSKNYLQDAT